MLGRHVIGVYSGPNNTSSGAVSVPAGHGPLMVTGAMQPEHARALARALHAAANAAELQGGEHV